MNIAELVKLFKEFEKIDDIVCDCEIELKRLRRQKYKIMKEIRDFKMDD